MKKKKKKLQQVSSFFDRHFVKKRRDCTNCHKSVDAYVKRCPHCYERMGDSILPKRFQNMIFLTDYKLLLIFLVGSVGLLLFSILTYQGLVYTPANPSLVSVLSNLIPSILSLSAIACILSYDIIDVLNSFKKTFYHIRPLLVALIGLAIIIGFSYGYQGILIACKVPLETGGNQSSLITVCHNQPALSFFYIVLFGPMLEELTYRLGLFTILRKKNRYLAYVVAVLLFAILHFDFFSNNLVNECINLPLYIFPAFMLTVLYEYEGISSSVYAHVLNNLISFIIILAVN